MILCVGFNHVSVSSLKVSKKDNRIIIGIDPGSNIMGYAVIEISSKQPILKQLGQLNLSKEKNHYLKLKKGYELVQKIFDEFSPDEMAIESPFYGKNIQSMMKLGRAQGACIILALQREVAVFEYAPKRVKQSVSGNGNASKEQIAKTLMKIFNIDMSSKSLDATDALAVALCHYYSKGKVNLSGKGSSKSWSDFVKNNPGRIKS